LLSSFLTTGLGPLPEIPINYIPPLAEDGEGDTGLFGDSPPYGGETEVEFYFSSYFLFFSSSFYAAKSI